MANEQTIPTRTFVQNFSGFMRSRGMRFIIMLALIFVMAIPIFMVWGVVADRTSYQTTAINEVSQLWGGNVSLSGPAIYVPVTKTIVTEKKEKDGTVTKTQSEIEGEPFILLAENLDIKVNSTSQIRRRGIFEIPVYQADFSVTAKFDRSRILPKIKQNETVHWKDAALVLKLPARRSFYGDTTARINGKPQQFEPGTPFENVSGMRIPLNFTADTLTAEANFALNGARAISVSPMARQTELEMTSDWRDPSFQGSFLPVEHSISETGFTANWSVPHLALSTPQVSRGAYAFERNNSNGSYYASGSFSDPNAFGVRFIQTLDFYHLVERAVKYGFLFVSLTFLTLFLLEGLSKVAVHPAQFLLIGIAETVFFLLLLAFSEQIGFRPAYLLASSATIALLGFYGLTALQLGKRVGILIALLILLYALLYIILQSTDYALLIGSVLCFGAVAATMIVTRNERWSQKEA